MLKGLVLAACGFAIFLLLHVMVFRIRVPQARFITMVRLATVVGLGLILTYWLTPRDLGWLPAWLTGAGWAVDLVNGLMVYAFLFIGYSMLYFLVDRGFSGRIMIEISRSPGERLRPHEIAARYSLEQVLKRRLGEMVSIGRVTLKDGRYRNTGKGRVAVKLFAFSKRFLQLGEGG
jgi:hypothetical protein